VAHSVALISNFCPSTRQQPKLQDHRHGASLLHCVPVYSPAYTGTRLYWLVTEANVCVNNLPKVALDNTVAGIEPAISSRKSNAPTYATEPHLLVHITGLIGHVCVCVCVCMWVCLFVRFLFDQFCFTCVYVVIQPASRILAFCYVADTFQK